MLLIPKLVEDSHVPQYLQLYEYIKTEIESGRIVKNSKLPSVRKLSQYLNVSTTIIEMSYNQLLAEGFIESKPRSGYYVIKLPESLSVQTTYQEPIFRRNFQEGKPSLQFDFHLSKNDFSDFPIQIWKRLYNEALSMETDDVLFYGDPQGEKGLRHEITKYLHQVRGVICSADQIIIGADQFSLLAILSLVLNKEFRELAVENPGYVLLPTTFKQFGFEVVPVTLRIDGIDLRELKESGSRLVYVSPSHSFPSGALTSLSSRLQLIEWAEEMKGFIIEDDYDGEFRYHGKPIPAIQGLKTNAPVIYLGGFSQSMAPALCIHYMILPTQLLQPYQQLKNSMLFEQSSSRIHQRALQLFMERGYLERYLSRMRTTYRKKHDTLIKAIKQHFGDKGRISGLNAGFHLVLEVASDFSEKEMIRLAKEAGIGIYSSNYERHKKEDREKKFIIGFASIPESKIDEGIQLLSRVWSESKVI